MNLGYLVAGLLLAVVLVSSGIGKLTRAKRVVEGLTGAGVPLRAYPYLAACEFAGAAGLVVGIWWRPLGLAAAIGVVLYFVGAVAAHVRTKDFGGTQSAGALLVLSIVTLIFSVVTL